MADNAHVSGPSPEGLKTGLKTAFSNPKARKGMIFVGVGLATVIGLSLLMSGGQQQQGAPAAVSLERPPPATPGDPMSPTTERYRELVRAEDERRVAEAAKTPGAMVIPKVSGIEGLTDPATQVPDKAKSVDVLADGGAPANLDPAIQASQQQQAQRAASDALRADPRYDKVDKLMAGIVEKAMGKDAQPAGWAVITPPSAKQNPGAAQETQAQTAAAAPGAEGRMPKKILIRAGETRFATLNLAVNTDFSGPVAATIRNGPFAGAVLIGEKQLENDAIVIKFTTMSPPDGDPSLSVNAYAIQITDAQRFGITGIEGHTDYHVMRRYVLPAAVAFVKAVGEAVSSSNSTTVTGAGGTVTSRGRLSDEDLVLAGLGGAATPIGRDVDHMASRPVTVTLPPQQEIGVFFMADVFEGDAPRPAQAAGQPQPAILPRVPAAGLAQLPVRPPQLALPAENSTVRIAIPSR